MKWKTRCDTTPGASRRRGAENRLCNSDRRNFLWAVLLATCQLAVAQGGQDLAYSDVLLQTGSGHIQGPIVPLPGSFNLNNLMGANRFYNAGFTGTNAVMANIEAGHIWSGHETLTHVANIPTYGAAGEVDRHATWVGMVMGGRPGGRKLRRVSAGHGPGRPAHFRRDRHELAD